MSFLAFAVVGLVLFMKGFTWNSSSLVSVPYMSAPKKMVPADTTLHQLHIHQSQMLPVPYRSYSHQWLKDKEGNFQIPVLSFTETFVLKQLSEDHKNKLLLPQTQIFPIQQFFSVSSQKLYSSYQWNMQAIPATKAASKLSLSQAHQQTGNKHQCIAQK